MKCIPYACVVNEAVSRSLVPSILLYSYRLKVRGEL
jgi:hypothetical protein